MPKIFNVDDLSPKAERELVLGGKTYALKGLTVEDFIKTTEMAKALDKKDATLAEQFELTIGVILERVPGLPREALLPLSLDQLQATVAFVRGVDPDDIIKMLAADSPDAVTPAAEGTPTGN
jgi:hypothetical protein